MKTIATCLASLAMLCSIDAVRAQQVLVEAESFATHGGWKLDTQFIDTMGSPYLLAHGLGQPVKDATTTVEFSETGQYRVEASGFAMYKRNYIFQDTDRNNIDDGKSKHLGVELQAEARYESGLYAGLAATYARHTYDFTKSCGVR